MVKALSELYEKFCGWLYVMFSMVRSQKGQTVIEYVLIIVLVSLVLVLVFVGSGVESGVSRGGSKISSALQ